MWRGSQRKASRVPEKKQAPVRGRQSGTRAHLARSKVAQQRTRIKMMKGAIVVVLVVAFFGGLSWLSFLDGLSVQQIVVRGNEDVRERAIQSQMMLATASASLGFFSRQNIFLYPREELKNILTFEYPKLEKVKIDRKFIDHRVVVEVVERMPFAVWCAEDFDCYHIDDNGFVFEPIQASSTNLVTFRGGIASPSKHPLRQHVAPTYFERVRSFNDDLEELGLSVVEFSFEENDARIRFSKGWELRIALDKDLDSAAFNLAAVLDEYELRGRLPEIDYVDMRFGERVYYKVRETTDFNE